MLAAAGALFLLGLREGTVQAVLLPYWVATAIAAALTLYSAARLELR